MGEKTPTLKVAIPAPLDKQRSHDGHHYVSSVDLIRGIVIDTGARGCENNIASEIYHRDHGRKTVLNEEDNLYEVLIRCLLRVLPGLYDSLLR